MLKKTGGGLGGCGSDRIVKTRRLQVNALRISNGALVVVYSILDTRIACRMKANQDIRRDLDKCLKRGGGEINKIFERGPGSSGGPKDQRTRGPEDQQYQGTRRTRRIFLR